MDEGGAVDFVFDAVEWADGALAVTAGFVEFKAGGVELALGVLAFTFWPFEPKAGAGELPPLENPPKLRLLRIPRPLRVPYSFTKALSLLRARFCSRLT